MSLAWLTLPLLGLTGPQAGAAVLFSASFDGTVNNVVSTTAGAGNYTPEVGSFSSVVNGSNATIQANPAGGSDKVLRLVRTGTPAPAVSPVLTGAAQNGATLSSGIQLLLSVDFYWNALGDAGGLLLYSSDVTKPIAGFNLNSSTGALRVNHDADSVATVAKTWYRLEMEMTFGTASSNQITGTYDVFLTAAGGTRTQIFDDIAIPSVSSSASLRLYLSANQKTFGDGVSTFYYRDLELMTIPEGRTSTLLLLAAGTMGAVGLQRRGKRLR